MFARSYVWWPGIDADIEFLVSACMICLQERKKPPKLSLTPWPWPEKPWFRIHIDFLGPFYNRMFLAIIDAHSKWPEIIDFKSNTTAEKLVQMMQKLFARHGFTSKTFKTFLLELGVKQSFSPPKHPAINGSAENFVGTFKDKVSKIVKGGKGLEEAINIFFFDYRSILHSSTGKSPAFLLYKRELRTRFDKLRPSAEAIVLNKQEQQIKHCSGPRNPILNVGDTVMAEDYSVGSPNRVPAEIVEQLTPSTFIIKIGDKKHKRHSDQIIDCKAEQVVRRSERLRARTDKSNT
ncbi:hypothetical protein TKK_0009979 [Trichogramma kaykai]